MLSVCSTRPGARGGEVELEVAGRVPGERRHPAVLADAEVVEHAAEPAGALGPVAVGGRARCPSAVAVTISLSGTELLGPPEEVRQREREVLHQTLHRVPLALVPSIVARTVMPDSGP